MKAKTQQRKMKRKDTKLPADSLESIHPEGHNGLHFHSEIIFVVSKSICSHNMEAKLIKEMQTHALGSVDSYGFLLPHHGLLPGRSSQRGGWFCG